MPTKGRGSGAIFPNNPRNTEQKLFRYLKFIVYFQQITIIQIVYREMGLNQTDSIYET